MDEIGSLDISWVQGYNGSNATFINQTTICYPCGNFIKFLDISSNDEAIHSSPGEGIGAFTVCGTHHVLAFSENCLSPRIFIYSYPSLTEKVVCKEGAQLEYCALSISNSHPYLISCSGVPDFSIMLWNMNSGELLCKVAMDLMSCTGLSFNPTDWHKVCCLTDKQLTVWTIQQADTRYLLVPSKISLPFEDGNSLSSGDDLINRPGSKIGNHDIILPPAAIAGLIGDIADTFDGNFNDNKRQVEPSSHCWTPSGDLYLGCGGGQLLLINTETFDMKMLHNDIGKRQNAFANKRTESILKMPAVIDESSTDDGRQRLGEGVFSCMALHRDGLYIGGEDGILRCLDVAGSVVQVSDSCPIDSPITSLNWSPNYAKLAIGSSKGSINLYDTTNPGTADLVLDTHFGNFVGLDMLTPGVQHCVTVREDGELQIWSIEDHQLVGCLPLAVQCCSLASSPSSHSVAVGTLSGHIYMIEVTNMENPRIVQRLRVHQHAVMHITYDTEGRYLFSGSDDGHIFVIDARPSKKFQVLAQTAIDGHIESVSTHTAEKHGSVRIAVTYTALDADINIGATKITQFDLPSDLNDNVSKYCTSLKMDLVEDSINKLNFNLNESSHGGAITGDRKFFALPHYSKQLHEIHIPEEAPKKANNKASYLQPQKACPNHELAGGVVTMSPHHQWVASGGSDGQVHARELSQLDCRVSVHAHSFHSGGVSRMCFSRDGMYLLTCGVGDGVLTCYTWNFSATGKGKVTSAIESARSHKTALHALCKREDDIMMEMPDWSPLDAVSREPTTDAFGSQPKSPKTLAMEADQIYVTPTPTPKGDPTWMEVKILEAIREEDKEFTEQKKNLRTEIRDLRRTIQSMMKENDVLPEIERLERHEFNLDTEDQSRLQAEGDSQVQQVREEIDFGNLAKNYLQEMIKNECWDSMCVKGRCTKAFHSNLEVSNYPMRQRTKEEKTELALVTKLRQIEIAEITARKEITEAQSKQSNKTEPEEGDDESVEGDGVEQPSTTGSLGAQYGGASNYFYSQFEMHTRQQKRNQIILLQDAIYRIKIAFNSEFDDVYRQKEQEISRIEERNARISKILKDLNSIEELWKPEMDEDEKPEKLLTVEEKEVKVEKFVTPEQQAKLDEEAKIEEQRRLLEKGDNDLQRGLDMMMGGVLEVKKEDELKKDVPQPTFIVNKPQEEWSEDELKVAKEYERKVKELNEEREKYKKTLEAELKKLQTIISDTTSNFDDKLVDIFVKKIKVEMVIFQEELKILRLNISLLIEEELSTRQEELLRQLEEIKARKSATVQAVGQAKKKVEEYRDTYDIRVAEDKVMDKNFRREFNDVNALIVDQLYKLYRRRPRGQRRIHHADSQTTCINNNPYGERPLSARQAGTLDIILKQLDEFDDLSHMPEEVESSVWRRMCAARRLKVKSEHEVKAQALTLADMNAFLQLRQDEDEKLKREMDDTMDELNQLRETSMRFNCNLEVQFLLKQGQVEIDSGEFIPNYHDSILIHRGVVEDLNGTIRQLGEQKIAAMTESKDFRKGIHILEWEHKKMVMQIQDLLNRAKDIQMLKVSRQIQDFLHNEDHEAKKQQEISTLEQTLENQRAHHDKNVKEKKSSLSTLRKAIHRKEHENKKVEGELQEMFVSVSERKHINEVNVLARDETGAEKRMKDIVQRRKLVDLAKAQAQEVAVLRAEVERLRMRTFPALVQVER